MHMPVLPLRRMTDTEVTGEFLAVNFAWIIKITQIFGIFPHITLGKQNPLTAMSLKK